MTISRRDFLKASGLMAAWTALSACAPNTETPPSHTHATPGATQAGTSQPFPELTQAAVSSAMPILEGEALLQHTLRRLTFGPGDLNITTDYRDVLGEVVEKRLKNPKLNEIFPNYTDWKNIGVVQG